MKDCEEGMVILGADVQAEEVAAGIVISGSGSMRCVAIDELVAEETGPGIFLRGAGNHAKIPAVYARMQFRNATPVDVVRGEIGIGFISRDGAIDRVCLSIADAKALAESVTDYLRAGVGHSHSDTSSGIPKVAVSTPEE